MRADWERVKQRYEAWWEGEILDRPLVRITAPLHSIAPAIPPREPGDLFDWLTQPELVIPRLEARMAATYYTGDAFPWADPMSQGLAAIQAAYLGAPYAVDPDTLTGWAGSMFDDWSQEPTFYPDPMNRWWQATLRLLDAGARRGGVNWAAAIPDLQGGGEILALLRGSEQLALDLLEHGDVIPRAISAINRAWWYYYEACYTTIHRWQPGYVDWLGIWSDKPAVTVECDYMVMVSPTMFERFFLPGVVEQVEMVERSVFHLDGPGAIRHLDFLLALPRLNGIQWVPTPDRPRPVEWLGLFQRIQAAGKKVVLSCPATEVIDVIDALKPEQLMLDVSCGSCEEADELLLAIEQRFGVR